MFQKRVVVDPTQECHLINVLGFVVFLSTHRKFHQYRGYGNSRSGTHNLQHPHDSLPPWHYEAIRLT